MVRLTSIIATATALAGAAFASCKPEAPAVQMITYVKRHPDISREEFWEYWQTEHAPKVVPLATHFGIRRYQQIQVGGMIPPTEGGATEPASTELVPFDGIAMFLYESAEALNDMLSHPYYLEVVAPDEEIFIDKEAFGGGMVATYIGAHIEAVDRAKDVWVGNLTTRAEYQEIFESYL